MRPTSDTASIDAFLFMLMVPMDEGHKLKGSKGLCMVTGVVGHSKRVKEEMKYSTLNTAP